MVFEQKLDNSLLLRTVRDENDIQSYADFNTAFNNPHEGVNSNLLLRYFPGSCLDTPTMAGRSRRSCMMYPA